MKIEISHGRSIVSPHTGKLLLPEIDIIADAQVSVSGLPKNVLHSLRYTQLGTEHTATFFLHPYVTAHLTCGDFDVYLTNNDALVGCFVCCKAGVFRLKQRKERKERLAKYTPQAFYAFCIIEIEDDEFTVIELLELQDTDKHIVH